MKFVNWLSCKIAYLAWRLRIHFGHILELCIYYRNRNGHWRPYFQIWKSRVILWNSGKHNLVVTKLGPIQTTSLYFRLSISFTALLQRWKIWRHRGMGQNDMTSPREIIKRMLAQDKLQHLCRIIKINVRSFDQRLSTILNRKSKFEVSYLYFPLHGLNK